MKLYTAQEVADQLDISYSRVRQIANRSGGRIGRKFAGVWMFNEEDIRRIRERRTEPGRPPQMETPHSEE